MCYAEVMTQARNTFGTVRKLPSGRYQAFYLRAGDRMKAPEPFPTRVEAENWLADQRHDLRHGTPSTPVAVPGGITVRQVAAEWLAAGRTKGKSVASLGTDEMILRLHILPVLGDRPVRDVTRREIQSLVDSWASAEPQPSPSTVLRRYATMSAVFGLAEQNDDIERTPCRKIDRPEQAPDTHYPLSPVEVEAIAEAFTRNGLAVLVAAICSLRWNEVYGLRITNVDLDAGTIEVERGLTRAGSRTVEGKANSRKARPRVLAVPAWLVDRLRDHIESLGRLADGNYLFPAPHGGVEQYTNWRDRVWQRAITEVGLADVTPSVTFHDLKAFGLTNLATLTDIKTFANRGGHTSVKTGMDFYARASVSADRAAADAMGALFASQPVGTPRA
jgi:integrase